jgi:hypothetical protein
MGNAKHIGCMWALAVALGVGIAVANTPAVALAAPADSGDGSSSSDSSSSNSLGNPGSASPHNPSTHSALSANTDGPAGHRRPLHPPGKTAAPAQSASSSSTGRSGTRATSEPRGTNSSKPAGAETPVAVMAPSAESVSRIVAPPANSTPTAPVQTPAEFTLLAFARRDFEHSVVVPSTTVSMPRATTSAVDPDFITSTHDFGLFSVTSAADPDDNHFVAFVFSSLIFTDILTSGTDPEDNLGFGPASIGMAGHTVNTFMSPFLNFSIALPVEDPFAELFTELVRSGF